jgi:Fic family protein
VTQPSTDPTPGQLDALYQPFSPFARWASTYVDVSLWDDFLGQLEAVRETVTDDDLDAAVDMVVRAAAFDTGAIEGLYETNRSITYSVAVQSAVWETEVARTGTQTGAYFAAQLAAYELILDAATRRIPIVEAWLRGLHAEITSAQSGYQVLTGAGWQTHVLPRGEYKREPNHVRTVSGDWHAFAPVKDTAAEVRRLVAELAAAEFTAAHPVLQAAYAHHALVAIHPFADGNGRLARALASVYLYRAARIPLLVYADQRLDYYRALGAADGGDYRPFVDFVFDRGLDALAILADRLRSAREAGGGRPAEGARALRRGQGGLSDEEVQTVGHRITEHLHAEIQSSLAGAELSQDVTVELDKIGRKAAPFQDPAYHPLAERGVFTLRFRSRHTRAPVESEISVGLAGEREARFAFCVVEHVVGDESHATPPMRLRLSDVYPELSRMAVERMAAWCASLIDSRLGELTRQAEGAPQAVGLARPHHHDA